MKKLLSLFLIVIGFFGISFAGGLYNLYTETYTYGQGIPNNRLGNDNTSDHCNAGEVNLKNHRGHASSAGSYTCGKIDEIAPSITISGIKPESKWVNIDKYNPIEYLKIEVRDAGAGIRKIVVTIGPKTAIWNFGYSNKKSSYTITYSNFCNKVGLGNDCYKNLLFEGKNNIRVKAYDAVLSYYNGAQDPSHSNIGNKTTQVWVDNSRSTYILGGEKVFLANGIVENLQTEDKWKNKTLSFTTKVKDKYGEGAGITIETKTCYGNPSNSIWTLPSGVDKDTGKFKSYNGSPSTSDCVWDCKIGYVKDSNECKKQEKKESCKTYFENKGYNLSNVDGEKLYFVLAGGGTIDPKTGEFKAIYNVSSHKYEPSTEKCLIKGGTTKVEYDAKDANGNPIKVSQDANLLTINSTTISYKPDRGQKSCGSLGNLIDFNNGGGQAGGNGDIKANYIYKLLSNYGGGYYDGKDHNGSHFVNDTNEMELWYEIVDANGVLHEDKDITKVCGEKVCVANSKELDSSSCRCIANYYPKDSTTDKVGRYSECIKLSTVQCLYDSNNDGYEDTIKTLGTNQIVNMKNIVYSTSKVPVCGKYCSNGYAKDTDGDGRKDACAVNGECGTDKDTCKAGKFKDIADSDDYYKWQCLGENGGDDSDICKMKKDIYVTECNEENIGKKDKDGKICTKSIISVTKATPCLEEKKDGVVWCDSLSLICKDGNLTVWESNSPCGPDIAGTKKTEYVGMQDIYIYEWK